MSPLREKGHRESRTNRIWQRASRQRLEGRGGKRCGITGALLHGGLRGTGLVLALLSLLKAMQVSHPTCT